MSDNVKNFLYASFLLALLFMVVVTFYKSEIKEKEHNTYITSTGEKFVSRESRRVYYRCIDNITYIVNLDGTISSVAYNNEAKIKKCKKEGE